MLDSDGPGEPRRRTTVIAEIASNHVGDLDRARQMVVQAATGGADVVSVPASADAASTIDDRRAGEWLKQVSLPDSAHRELATVAAQTGIGFTSAPSTIAAARFLVEELHLRAIKLESSEMLNLDLLDYLDGKVRTIYLGTGLADLEEVKLAVSRLQHTEDVVVMHCVDQYPLAAVDANLRAITTIAQVFPAERVGYLDHTIGLLAPLLAVALGATAVEKHFTLDRSLPGTDHVQAITPSELSELVHGLRETEALLGGEPPELQDRGRLALVRDPSSAPRGEQLS